MGVEGSKNEVHGSQTPEGLAQKGERIIDGLDRQGYTSLQEYADAFSAEVQRYQDEGITAELEFAGGGQGKVLDIAYNVSQLAAAREDGKSWEEIEGPNGFLSRARIPEGLYEKLKHLDS